MRMETWKGFVQITELSGLSFCPFHKYKNANLPDCTSEWGTERLQSWGFCICDAFCGKIITEVKCVSILYPLKKKNSTSFLIKMQSSNVKVCGHLGEEH